MSISSHFGFSQPPSSASSSLFFTFTALIIGLVPLSFFLFASPSFSVENKTATKKDVAAFRIKINRLQQGIDSQENKIHDTENQERNLLLEMEVLDKKLADQQTRLDDLEVQMDDQRALIEKKSVALENIRLKKNVVARHLIKRIKAYYTMGGIGLLNVTFSTKNLPELLQFHDSFDTLIKYDQNVIAVYQMTIQDIERAKTALTLEESILQDFIDQTVREQKEAAFTKNQKENLLTHIRTQGKLHKQAIKEMQQASETLADELVALKSKADAHKNGFSSKKRVAPATSGRCNCHPFQ